MTKGNAVTVMGVVVVAALASACSSEPGRDYEPASVLEPPPASVASLPPNCLESDVVPGQSYAGPAPSSFRTCELYHADGTFEESAPPTFILRLKDCRNAMYCGSGLACDGYQIPFPTPWITNVQGGTCSDPVNCAYDPGPYDYERKLLSDVLGMVAHQFDMIPLTLTGNPKFPYTVGASTRFYNGTPNNTQFDSMKNVVTMPQWTDPNVYPMLDIDPHSRKCTYVLQYDASTNGLVYSGFHAPVAQAHDVVAWPSSK